MKSNEKISNKDDGDNFFEFRSIMPLLVIWVLKRSVSTRKIQ